MIKTEVRRGLSPYSANKKPTTKNKDEHIHFPGVSKISNQARMVGTSAPPKPVYLIPPFDEGMSNKLTSTTGKKLIINKKPTDKIDHIIAAKSPKTKIGPTNGVVYLQKSDVLESVGFHSAAGKSDGRVKTNQDSFIVDMAFKGDHSRTLLGVFDGHGLQGHKVSNFLVQNLREVLELPPGDAPTSEIAISFTDTCHNLHNMLKKCVHIDSKLSGSTGVLVLVEPNRITCANVGDSRAILFTPLGNTFTAFPLSIDQKPSDPQEKARILNHGGKVHPSRRTPL